MLTPPIPPASDARGDAAAPDAGPAEHALDPASRLPGRAATLAALERLRTGAAAGAGPAPRG